MQAKLPSLKPGQVMQLTYTEAVATAVQPVAKSTEVRGARAVGAARAALRPKNATATPMIAVDVGAEIREREDGVHLQHPRRGSR